MKAQSFNKMFLGLLVVGLLTSCGKGNNSSGSSKSSNKTQNVQILQNGGTGVGTANTSFASLKKLFANKDDNDGVKANYQVIHSYPEFNPVTSNTNWLNSVLGALNVNSVSTIQIKTKVLEVNGDEIEVSVQEGNSAAANDLYERDFYYEIFEETEGVVETKVSKAEVLLSNNKKIAAYVVQHFIKDEYNFYHENTYIVSPNLPNVANPIQKSNRLNEDFLQLNKIENDFVYSITGQYYIINGFDYKTGKPTFKQYKF